MRPVPAATQSLSLATITCMVLLIIGNLAAARPASADDARYSLGSVQEEREVHVVDGSPAATTLAFYNIDGNVPTTLEVRVSEAPADWRVTLGRPGDIDHASESITLTIEPSTPDINGTKWSGTGRESIWLPQRGMVYADVVQVWIQTPVPSAETHGVVRVDVTATWETGSSSAPFPQEREFIFDVDVNDAEPAPQDVDASLESPIPLSGHAPWLVAGCVCAAGCVFAVRRAVAKSG